MPTENRSSNTEMLSLSRDLIGLTLAHLPNDSAAKWEIYDLLAQPAPQPHPDPIAWMVGTAFWWTKDEAERDAAETGLPIVGLGPMLDSAEVEQLRAELRVQDALLEEAYQRDIGTPLKRKIRAQRVALSASAEPSEPVAEVKP
ncbi:hypothetical protein [Pseudomonas sp. BNK-43-a]|uniref:hypothetical protein n=1 Tax=unclassified Pseudomonas TaxID=196821 RepID=UPI0039BF9E7A